MCLHLIKKRDKEKKDVMFDPAEIQIQKAAAFNLQKRSIEIDELNEQIEREVIQEEVVREKEELTLENKEVKKK